MGRGILGLSDAGRHSGGHLESPAPGSGFGAATECRAILESLIEPLGLAHGGAIVDELLDEFGTLPAILAADPAQLHACLPEDGHVADLLVAMRVAMLHSLRTRLSESPILSTSEALTNYLFASMAYNGIEHLRVLFLNSSNRLLRDELMSRGTVNQAPLYPREILKRALELGATALILVHNHPSGDPTPCQADVKATAHLVAAARTLDIAVHDHLIVARTGWRSLRAEGLV
ncbi:RadC family protein [Rhizorhabdus sp.]|uniref:JAB domain-containing protein n=1 Tax=Rhizorhabdus sp. TaxID=1968843 RepID=UPI0035B00D35